ncbi:MAG: hypothetical protein R6T93_01085 [Trueperaceae bacterium]
MFEVDRALVREAALSLASARGLRWVIGGACSGKSSVCRTISRWTGVPVFDMDEHIYGRYMSRYSPSRHPASSAWFKRRDGLAWVLSLPWEAFDDLNRATNAEFLDLVARDVSERYGDRPVLVDGGITHPSVLAAVVDPARIACLAVDDAESRRIWEEDEARSGMRRAVEGLPGGAERWATFLTFDERMSATIEREAREQGIVVLARTRSASVEELSRVVMGALGIEREDGAATGPFGP